MRQDSFSGYNPAINFAFYIGAVVFGMCFIHPAFLICACILSAAYYVTVRGAAAFKVIGAMVPVFVIISLINPLFNRYGTHVLFTYFGGRPYTLEALYYGMAIGGMFVTVIMWFASYNVVMTSDKFLYLFGRIAPSVSLVFTMVLRLVPNFMNKAKQYVSARMSIGRAGDNDTKKERLKDGTAILSALTSWALEGGVITADSMRSRGYGTGKRTSFVIYRFDGRDVCLCCLMVLLGAVIVFCGIMGGMEAAYTPEVKLAELGNPYCTAGLAAYIIFIAIPTVLNVAEEITWRILRSKI